MKTARAYISVTAITAGTLGLAACGGGGTDSSASMSSTSTTTSTPTVTAFVNTALVSNTAPGTVDTLPANTVASGDSSTFTFPPSQNPTLDPHLSHSWGVAFGPNSAVWVNDHASNLSSLYDGDGNLIPTSEQPAVAIPPNASAGAAGPTAIVANI